MDKNAIRKYAIWAREELIKRVSTKAEEYGISKDNIIDENADSIGDKILTATEKSQRKNLIEKIKEKGYSQVVEEVAYTWFNRFIALRFMEVNGYLPTRVSVFTDGENNFKPQILEEAIHLELDGLKKDVVFELKEKNENEALYKYLLITQCNALSSILPKMFPKIGDFTILLFPDNVLREGSVIEQLIAIIPEQDFDINSIDENGDTNGQVEILGWLYQYYNSVSKDIVFANLKKNIKITKENIPAATQLFTPDWIVRYMVENSLGRIAVEKLSLDPKAMGWKYYLEEAEQTEEVKNQLAIINGDKKDFKLEELKVIDPCMGSGHILVYAFDVLMQIYESQGYTSRDAVASIMENNLFGLDIDERAYQLSYFALMMKARANDRRFLAREIAPQVYCPKGYADGEEYGSLLNVDELEEMPQEKDEITLFEESFDQQLNTWNFRRLLNQKYDVVVTNPPYMGNNGMNSKLSDYAKTNFPDNKGDFFAMFFEQSFKMLKHNGFSSLITMQSWMFLSTYEALRRKILNLHSIYSCLHLGENVMGIGFGTVASIVRKSKTIMYIGSFVNINISDLTENGILNSLEEHSCMYVQTNRFLKIPNIPIAYWISDALLKVFEIGVSIENYANTFQGIITGNNDRFLRIWTEVDYCKIALHKSSMDDIELSEVYWIPYNKGGEFRKWYGIQDYVVNWCNGPDDKTRGKKGFSNFYLKEYVAWSYTVRNSIATRYYPKGFLWDVRGSGLMDKNEMKYYLEALISSKVGIELFHVNNSTISCQVENILQLPIIFNPNQKDYIDTLVELNNTLSKTDWDSFETSWDFDTHPLLNSNSIKSAFENWENECTERFSTLKQNEEELNRIFIDIYGLQDELTPEVEDKDVTVRLADKTRDIKSFISYAVGCMFGRYSLDVDGLAYAGGEFDNLKYSTFIPDADNIIPICDDEYFEDDIVGRFIKFVEAVYGTATLDENLEFIASALGTKGTAREVIRNYFLNSFYADHCKIYQKRPIYWLFDSGKKNGFKALVYMHRYAPDTIARMRTDYVHEQQGRYRTALSDLERRIEGATTSERVKLTKVLAQLKDQAEEIRVYEEKVHHLADQMISIDLDDGVKSNYTIFGDVLAKIK